MTILVTPRQIAQTVVQTIADLHGVDVDLVLGRCKKPMVVAARNECFHQLATTFPSWSITRIANYFDIGHSSIIKVFKREGYPPHLQPRGS